MRKNHFLDSYISALYAKMLNYVKILYKLLLIISVKMPLPLQMSTARVSSVFLPGDTGLLCEEQTAQ